MNNPQLAQSNETSRMPLLILFSLVFLLIATLASSYDPIIYAHGSDEDPIKQMVAVTCAQIPGSEISSAECVALQAFYNSTNGSSWGNWFTNSTPCSTPWTGLTCANGHVTNIYLKGLNISGTLPTELGNLSWLQVFKADSNNISGTIPASLGDLSNLTELDIGENNLNGSIPTTLCKLSNLWRLDLIQNQLTGPFPSCSNVQLGSLQILYVDGNSLSGSLPNSIGYMTQLTQLSLARNNFDGTVPDSICSLTKLQSLWVNTTSLSGSLPLCMSGMNQLSKFRFNETDICEPNDSTFQNWLDSFNSSDLSRTGVICTGPVPVTVQFKYSSTSVDENVGNATIEVTLSQSSSQTVSVTYATSNGTATSGSDYTSRNGTLSFSPGQTSKTFTIPIINDIIDENNESFYLSLSNVGNADLGTPSTATLTIVDDDSTIKCYTLNLEHSGSGNNPTASPGSSSGCSLSEYTAGESITLTAVPSSGWQVASWSGTDNESSASTSNTVTMPASDHTVTVNYQLVPTPESRIYLPITFDDYFSGLQESEPNNSYLQADGPLPSGQLFRGYPDDPRDYVNFTTMEYGQIEVSLNAHVGQGVQLQLFHGPASEISRVAIDFEPPYQFSYSGAAGTYYVMIFTESGFDDTTPYTLWITYPN